MEKNKNIVNTDNKVVNIYDLFNINDNNIFKFYYKYNYINLIEAFTKDNTIELPIFLTNYISNKDIEYKYKIWCLSILNMYGFKRYFLPNIGKVQNLLLNLDKNRLQKLLLAIGLILTETPSYCIIKNYRLEILKILTSAELNFIIEIWPGKKKKFNPIIKPDLITKYSENLAISILDDLLLYDPIWSYVKLQFNYKLPNEYKIPNKIPNWWDENWFIRIEEIIK